MQPKRDFPHKGIATILNMLNMSKEKRRNQSKRQAVMKKEQANLKKKKKEHLEMENCYQIKKVIKWSDGKLHNSKGTICDFKDRAEEITLRAAQRNETALQ